MKKKENQQANAAPEEAVQDSVNPEERVEAQPAEEGAEQAEATVEQWQAALETAVTADPDKAKKYAELLYDQALLIAGLPLEDPSAYTDLVCELMK